MNDFLHGFTGELTKTAVVGKALLKVLGRNKLKALGYSLIPAFAGFSAYQAGKTGRSGIKGRQIHAQAYRPSRTYGKNYNVLTGKRPVNKDISKSYKKELIS